VSSSGSDATRSGVPGLAGFGGGDLDAHQSFEERGVTKPCVGGVVELAEQWASGLAGQTMSASRSMRR
jgi:hypothetical protein